MNLDFISSRARFYVLSIFAILISLVLLFSKGLNLSIEFRSGSVMRIGVKGEISADDMRKVLEMEKFSKLFSKFTVQKIAGEDAISREGSEFFITSDFLAENANDSEGAEKKISHALEEHFPGLTVYEFVNIGPSIGDDLKESAVYSIVFSLLVILLYITVRFEFRYSVVSVLALFHDVIIVLGILAIAQKEFSTAGIAAILTLIGYSLNDTIIVLDRLRENLRLKRKENFDHLVNVTINETLSRTLKTSVTTLVPVVILYVFGGTGVETFSFTMLVGLVVGTYSSICVAAPLLVTWNKISAQSEPKPQTVTVA